MTFVERQREQACRAGATAARSALRRGRLVGDIIRALQCAREHGLTEAELIRTLRGDDPSAIRDALRSLEAEGRIVRDGDRWTAVQR